MCNCVSVSRGNNCCFWFWCAKYASIGFKNYKTNDDQTSSFGIVAAKCGFQNWGQENLAAKQIQFETIRGWNESSGKIIIPSFV